MGNKNCTTTLHHEDRSRLVPGRSICKMNALLKRMTLALNQDVIEGRAEIDAINGPDDCNDGHNGMDYYCPDTDKCCSHKADNGNDGDWVCCPAACAPVRCAAVDWACGAC